MIELTGKIEYIPHFTEDFAIAKMRVQNELHTIKGSLYGIEKGETVSVQGEWVDHPKYGRQFAVERWERPLPKTHDQIIEFLASKLVKGCGKKRAMEIVNCLGDQALEIIMRDGAVSLAAVKGIGVKRAKEIAESIQASFEIQKIMMALLPYGITANVVMKIYKKFGAECIDIIHRNPYRLTEINLIGFMKADEIARRMGISQESSYRIHACINHVLTELCYNGGHCYVEELELIRSTLLALNNQGGSVSEVAVRKELEWMSAHERVVWEGNRIFPKHLYSYETKLAEKLACMAGRSGEAMPVVENMMRQYQSEHRMVLAEKQRDAIRELFQRRLVVITGNPGTGKTTVVKAMIMLYQKLYPKHSIGLAAPTGRASRKLEELTGLPAETIHRMIGFRAGEESEYGSSLPLPLDLLIIDEVSMLDVQLAHYLFQAVGSRTKVVLIGDSDQLPSVNPGNVLHDILAAGVAHVRLTEIFRQAQGSQIIMNAHRVNQGKFLEIDPHKDDFYFIQHEAPEHIAFMIERSVVRLLQKGRSIQDILVLSPMKKGPLGTDSLNTRLQSAINPADARKAEWQVGERLYRQGDKVIKTKNDYEKAVLNGDIGTVKAVGVTVDEEGEKTDEKALICDFHGKEISFSKEDLKYLQLAYAITIHKAQGGQAPVIIMPISTSHYVMLARNLVYTGITRAESMCVLIGTKKALSMAISNNKVIKRNTGLCERIVRHMEEVTKWSAIQ